MRGALSVALIDHCSSKYLTGVETENLRRIRDSRVSTRTTGANTLPDDTQTSRAVTAPRRKWKRLNNEARARRPSPADDGRAGERSCPLVRFWPLLVTGFRSPGSKPGNYAGSGRQSSPGYGSGVGLSGSLLKSSYVPFKVADRFVVQERLKPPGHALVVDT